jgi:putative ABC transport system ATP-binding protein
MSAAIDPVPGPLVELTAVSRDFKLGSHVVHALDDVDLVVQPGEFVALHGRSGSGKTTLLNVVGGLDRPTSGRVGVCGHDLMTLPERDIIALRRDRLAFIFQAFGLLPILSAAENVEIPLRLQRAPVDERRDRVMELLDLVGLAGRADHRPHELSGGEQQRVAIARALANDPDLLIADEPTGQLDSGTGRVIMDLLRDLVDQRGLSMLVATHDPTMIADADRVVGLEDGHIREGGIVRARFEDKLQTERRTITTSPTLPAPSTRATSSEDVASEASPDEPADEAPAVPDAPPDQHPGHNPFAPPETSED